MNIEYQSICHQIHFQADYTIEKNDYKFLSIKKTYIAFYKIVGDEVRVVRVFRGEQD